MHMHASPHALQDESKALTPSGEESVMNSSSAAIENVYEDIQEVGTGMYCVFCAMISLFLLYMNMNIDPDNYGTQTM